MLFELSSCAFATGLEGERQELAALWGDAALRYAHDLNATEKSQRAADVLARLHYPDRLDEEVLRSSRESLHQRPVGESVRSLRGV